MAAVPPGWYDDPEDGSALRYWDGQDWAPRLTGIPAATPSAGVALAVRPRLEIRLEDLDPEPGLAPEPRVGGRALSRGSGPPAHDRVRAEGRDAAWVAGDDVVPWPSRAAASLAAALASWAHSLDRASNPSAPARPGYGPGGAAPPVVRRRVVPGPAAAAPGRPWLVPTLVVAGVVAVALGVAAAVVPKLGDPEPPPTTITAFDAPPVLPPATVAPSPSATPTTVTPTTITPVPSQPPATVSPSSGFEVGASFSQSCRVAWPTNPVRDATGIRMQMSCPGVPAAFFVVQVRYDDPAFEVTPSSGPMLVTGHVVDITEADGGVQVLVVEADVIDRQR